MNSQRWYKRHAVSADEPFKKAGSASIASQPTPQSASCAVSLLKECLLGAVAVVMVDTSSIYNSGSLQTLGVPNVITFASTIDATRELSELNEKIKCFFLKFLVFYFAGFDEQNLIKVMGRVATFPEKKFKKLFGLLLIDVT